MTLNVIFNEIYFFLISERDISEKKKQANMLRKTETE